MFKALCSPARRRRSHRDHAEVRRFWYRQLQADPHGDRHRFRPRSPSVIGQEQIHLTVTSRSFGASRTPRACARARRHRLDGLRRQDEEAQEGREEPADDVARRPRRRTATSRSRSFRSRSSSMQARPTLARRRWTGATGVSEPAIMTDLAADPEQQKRLGPPRSSWNQLSVHDGNHGFQCTNGPASKSNETTVSNIPTSGTYASMICPSRDNGSKSTTATGLLSNRYYSGCYTSTLKANTTTGIRSAPDRVQAAVVWDPMIVSAPEEPGATVSARSDLANVHQTGSRSRRDRAMSCGSLSSSDCECSGNDNNKVCRQKAYDHTWRPSPKTAWDGCVRDRNQNFDVENTAPSFAATNVSKTNINGTLESYQSATEPTTSNGFQPFQYSTCPASADAPLVLTGPR